MTGRAIVTTRLSSETMSNASEVIAKVHRTFERSAIRSISFLPARGRAQWGGLPKTLLVSDNYLWWRKRGRVGDQISMPMQPSRSIVAHGSVDSSASIDAITLSN